MPLKFLGIKQIWAYVVSQVIMKTWRTEAINVVYTWCVLICILDITIHQRGMALTDGQVSHSGNEIPI